jgi:hypothetical protein
MASSIVLVVVFLPYGGLVVDLGLTSGLEESTSRTMPVKQEEPHEPRPCASPRFPLIQSAGQV